MEENSYRHVNHQGFSLNPDAKISFFHRLMRGRIGVIIFLLVTGVFTAVPTVFISWPVFVCMLTGFVSLDTCRRFVNWSFGAWLYMESYFLDKILGTHIRVFGDSKDFSDRSLIIMNHRCHFDWIFFFSVVCKQGDPKKWMTVLKDAGKKWPILGWAMQLRNFMFVSRNWSKDEREFKLKLNYLKALNSKYQLLLFPEGTDLYPHSCTKSDQYAKENNYPLYDYVLHPKTTGFKYILKTLRDYKIDTVHDVTVGYPDIFAPTEKELVLEGRVPREIHYHVKSYSASSLPVTDDGLDKWIRQRWLEKEERLRVFYANRRFHELPLDRGVDCNGDANTVSSSTLSPEVHNPFLLSGAVHAIVFCVVNLCLWGYLCFTYWYMAMMAVLLLAGIMYISVYTRGADYMIMKALDNEDFHKLLMEDS